MECDCGLIGLIKSTYPISFITIIGGLFGAALAYVPRRARIITLERQLGFRPHKAEK
jgi:nicotinamide riboside transporter PnuC